MLTRTLTGIVLLSFTIFALIQNGLLFWSMVTGLALLCLKEIMTIKAISKHPLIYIGSMLLLLGIFYSVLDPNSQQQFWNTPLAILASLVIISISAFELYRKKPITLHSPLLSSLQTLLLLGLTLPFILIIRNLSSGLADSFLLLIVITCTDSAAYFIGKQFGKTPLTSISPKKTLEGTIGGSLFSTAVGIAVITAFNLPYAIYIPITLLVICTAQLGDIHESLFKRHHNIKDSSQILPGHGGIYDRIDGYLFSFPVFFCSKTLLESLL